MDDGKTLNINNNIYKDIVRPKISLYSWFKEH
jgi:hypothetical protein